MNVTQALVFLVLIILWVAPIFADPCLPKIELVESTFYADGALGDR
jgi:hypothetical protein